MDKQQTLALLNHPDVETRLANLARLLAEEAAPPTPRPQFANNHIHTFYSFSPYSPAAAVWFAREAGLQSGFPGPCPGRKAPWRSGGMLWTAM